MKIVFYKSRRAEKQKSRNFLRSYGLMVLWSYALMVLLIFPLNAQNLYEYAQEELFLTSQGIRDRYESTDCATARDYISRFHSADAKGNDNEKQYVLRVISFFQCSESYTFFENQIKSSRDETNRCQALMFLALMQNADYLPVILEYANKPSLSLHEKAAIATALTVLRSYNLTVFTEQSIQILDEICYDAPVDVLATCILNYFNIKGDAAIKFFNSHLEKEEYKLYAALFLAKLGEKTTTFPIFAAALSSEDENERHIAILGLAAINTEEATALLINLPPEKNRITLRERLINFNPNEIMKGD